MRKDDIIKTSSFNVKVVRSYWLLLLDLQVIVEGLRTVLAEPEHLLDLPGVCVCNGGLHGATEAPEIHVKLLLRT